MSRACRARTALTAAPSPRRRAAGQGGHADDLGRVAGALQGAAGDDALAGVRATASARPGRRRPAADEAPASPARSGPGRRRARPARPAPMAVPRGAEAERGHRGLAAQTVREVRRVRVEQHRLDVRRVDAGGQRGPGRAPSAAPGHTDSPVASTAPSRDGTRSCTHSIASGTPSSRWRARTASTSARGHDAGAEARPGVVAASPRRRGGTARTGRPPRPGPRRPGGSRRSSVRLSAKTVRSMRSVTPRHLNAHSVGRKLVCRSGIPRRSRTLQRPSGPTSSHRTTWTITGGDMTAPAPQGLYDPRHEHDSCGVAFVVDVAGRRSHDVVARGRAALCRLDHRGARGAEPNTGDGAGVMIQIPDEFYRAVVDFELPPAGRVRDRSGLPADRRRTTRPGRSRCWRSTRWSRAPRCSAGATCRSTPTDLGHTALAAQPRIRQVFLAAQRLRDGADGPGRRAALRAGARAGHVLRAQADRAGDPRPRRRDVLPVAVQPHHRLQGNVDAGPGDHVLPGPVRRAGGQRDRAGALAASPPTRSRPGRWPTRTATSPTMERSTRSGATGTGWPPARRCCAAALIPGDLRRIFPVCTPSYSDSANFDEVLELLHLGGRSLPHAMLMMIPEAWENDDSMDAAAARLLPLPLLPDGAVGRSGQRRLHRRYGRRRGAGPQRPAPGPMVAHPRRPGRAGQRGRRARRRPVRGGGQGPAAAGPDVPGRHRRPAGSSRTTRSRRSWPAPRRTATGCTPA